MGKRVDSININNIDVFPLRISEGFKDLNHLKSFLSKDEINKSNRYYTQKLTNEYIVCRGSLRKILGKYLDLEPNSISFEYNPYGKPEVSKDLNINNIKFNVSHSGDYCIIAISKHYEIGVDIEEIKPLEDFRSIAERFYSSKEVKSIKNMNDFYTIWAQKEAVIKASGKGLSFGLDHWSTISTKKNYCITIESNTYSVTAFSVDEMYSSAICILNKNLI